MANKIDYRINNIKIHTESAKQDYFRGNKENTLNNLRKAAEAICRAIILNKMGEVDGEKIILGEVDINLNPKRKRDIKTILLNDLIKIVNDKRWLNQTIFHRLKDIHWGGNSGSHDSISVNQEVSDDDVELCIMQYKNVLDWFYKTFLNSSVPSSLLDFENGKTIIKSNDSLIWNNFFLDCNQFNKDRSYVLIVPPNFANLSENQFSIFSRINWSMIIDFNPETKENGLFKALSKNPGKYQIRPISIEEKDKRERIINVSHYTLNYIFANGISSIPGTISTNPRNWRSELKYASFLKRLVEEYLIEKVQNTTYVYLYDERDYIQEIIRSVDESISNPGFAKHVIVYNNSEKLSRLEDEFRFYDVLFHNIPLELIIAGIERSLIPTVDTYESNLKQIPCRGQNDSDSFIDISSNFYSMQSKGVEILHQSITNGEIDDDNNFYKGETISWNDLVADLDATRHISTDLTAMLQKWLDHNKGGFVVELRHKPGAGGTTLSRRMAYTFMRKYPTVIIDKYYRDKTNQVLFELSEITQKPILAIVEAFLVTQNELNALIRKINEDKKHVVVLYVIRSFNGDYRGSDKSKTLILNDKTIDLVERDKFYSKYFQSASSTAKEELKKLKLKNPGACEVIDFAITAYQEEYSSSKLEDYILYHLNKLPQNHLKFIGFASMIYYYAQISTMDLWFSNLFENGSLSSDYLNKKEDEKYILKLFIHELDEEYEETNYWRPRFNLFAEEQMALTFVGLNKAKKGNWKDFLARWSIDLIKTCKANHATLTDDLRDMFKSLFLNRDNEDVLGQDDNYEYSSGADRKFSTLIRHIGKKEEQYNVLKALVDCYPNESHLRGHLGRFLYEKATEQLDFENAYDEITQAIELGENDYNLWHLKGMSSRRRIEFLIRSDISKLNEDEISELEEFIKELTETANEDFEKSRAINPHNLHSHTAQVQMLIQVINNGRRFSKSKSQFDFLTNIEYKWYDNQLSEIMNLIDEAKYIIELSTDLDQSLIIEKSKRMIQDCEGKLFRLQGEYSNSVDKFKQLANSSDRDLRPYYRRMFIYSTLASKVDNNFKKFPEAWNKLSPFEFESIIKVILENIEDEPDNTVHAKMWLQAVRHSKGYTSLDDAISIIKLWYNNSGKYEIPHLEATYYLYVLYACKAISEGNSVSDFTLNEAKAYIKECKERKVNDKFSFEWYGKGEGIKILTSHTKVGKMNPNTRFFDKTELLGRVEGTIALIDDRQKGRIKLRCGLDAFFVPSNGGFEKDRDELTNVNFYIGFRQDQLMAWEVKKIGIDNVAVNSDSVDIEGYDSIDELIEEPLAVENIIEPTKIEKDFEVEKVSIKQPKILGKIDLSQFDKYKKKRK
ncbi:MAG: hypothetical protein BGO31_10850 [Bacteroidetes bacterium 43-16]|uniref:hypothetical protein n=1 Tax=uncultured Dysgonomonas sp. TaxID=206096 RepID=UPI0009297BE8|nr:hypothetical protein [uncultured Dysgonomonas sp.]OJV50957.1 MAG: hypothetical protein BGO31_10850 [Bacteroidetes bacterium 43-16]